MRCDPGPVAPIDALLGLMGHSDIFESVPIDALQQIALAMQIRSLTASTVLMRQGDVGDSMYLLLEGSLLLTAEANGRTIFKDRLSAGAVLGELALSTGYPRSATVAAESDITVAELDRQTFYRLVADDPDAMSTLLLAIGKRLERHQINATARDSELLNRMSQPLLRDFIERMTVQALHSGETLLRAGDIGDAMYLIVSGRLRVTAASDTVAIAELGRGDTVGETSLMTGEPRSATVVALRDSLVASLDAQAFKTLIERHPLEMMTVFTRQLTERARAVKPRTVKQRREHDRAPVSIAVVPLSPRVNTAAFTSRLRHSLECFGEIAILSSDTPTVRNTRPAAESRLVEWLNEQERCFRHVLYQTDGAQSMWTQRSLRQADRILLLVDAATDLQSAVGAMHKLTAQADSSLTAMKELELIFLHQAGAAVPTNIAQWRAAFPTVRQHHHLRLDRKDDFERLARSINHRLVGVAFGGGFALGIAHVGVVRAMRELKIPIDCAGGTSMGAVIAAECAMDFDYEQMLDIIVNGCASSLKGDYTLPFLSLLSGAKLGRTLGRYLEKHTLEDFWLPYFSISASLRQARMIVHSRGDALRSVLASCRAPVMFPPLPWNGDLLVDGGLVNNVPADVMREFVPGGTVIAIDVSPNDQIASPSEAALSVSGWRRAARRLKDGTQPDLSLLDVLGRIIRLGGVTRTEQNRKDADCYLTPPLGDFKALDFDRGREIAEMSYAYALETLGQWLEQHGRPWDLAEPGTRTPLLPYFA